MDALHALMLERMDNEDDGFLLATTATSARMLAQAPTRAALLAHPEVAARFAELLQHPAREVGATPGCRVGWEQEKACGGPFCRRAVAACGDTSPHNPAAPNTRQHMLCR